MLSYRRNALHILIHYNSFDIPEISSSFDFLIKGDVHWNRSIVELSKKRDERKTNVSLFPIRICSPSKISTIADKRGNAIATLEMGPFTNFHERLIVFIIRNHMECGGLWSSMKQNGVRYRFVSSDARPTLWTLLKASLLKYGGIFSLSEAASNKTINSFI